LIRQMQTGPLKGKFDLTIKQLTTSAFEDAFQRHFGPSNVFLKQSLGKP
jgi:hypothetical protein